ncbi:MAG: NPCBM/NEW2 domain-containing protein [Candidatus Hydrogenedentes bacterium]|nr:NPCBM/NEW2 domain-containing protein [Candidatus Hydrogenedentota bacterium]
MHKFSSAARARYLHSALTVVFISLAALLILFAFGQPASADTVYVSPSGDDANPGTIAKPFASLERARDALRSVPRSHNRTVVLREGIYRISKTLLLGPEDSGTDRAPAVWQAAKGESVRLIGGTRLTKWQAVSDETVRARLSPDAREHVMQCDLKESGVEALGTVQPQSGARAELFFNHHYMPLARYPNEGWLKIADVPPDKQFKFIDKDDPNLTRHRGPFQYDGDRPKQWSGASDIWVHGYWTYDWSDEYEPVERIDFDTSLIWPKPPYHGYGYTKGQRYYFLNILEELDQAGEWYLDRQNRIVYFWPPAALDKSDVMFPDLEQPMIVMDNVEHAALRGITFECSRAEAVVVKGGASNEIDGCVVRNVGRTAIDIKGGARHTVRSCDIYEVASTGIGVEGGDRATLSPGGHVVDNCDIHHFARIQKTYHPAVSLNGVGNRMTHCYVHDAPHQGVSYGGNDHVIEYCEFTRIAHETGDVGVIYSAMDWSYMGHVFRYNYFHNIHGPGELGCFTIYPDLPCGGIHLYGNVFCDMDQGFLTNSGRGMTIENNLFLRCARTYRFNVWEDLSMFRPGGPWEMVERLERIKYDQPPYSTRYPVLARLAEDFAKGDAQASLRIIPKDNIIRCNVSTGPHFLGLGAKASLADVKLEKNLIANSVVFTGSPSGDGHSQTYSHDDEAIKTELGKTGNVVSLGDGGVVAPDREDFRLRANSPAHKLGFKKIPFDEIGLYTDPYRRRLPLRAPVLSPSSRFIVGETELRLTPNRRGARAGVRYTLDGTDPTATSPEYRRPIRLTQTTTIKAAAFGRGAHANETSEIVSATFTAAYLGAGHGVYLSDLDEIDYTGPDGLGSLGLLKNRAPHDQPLRLGGTEYKKGLIMQLVNTPNGAEARLTYALEGSLAAAQRFTARVGIDDSVPATAKTTCAFKVEVRRDKDWRQVFDSGPLAPQQPPQTVDVDTAGADRLRLIMTGGGESPTSPRPVWANPRVE